MPEDVLFNGYMFRLKIISGLPKYGGFLFLNSFSLREAEVIRRVKSILKKND